MYTTYVSAHGYMELPAARNCMWRFGFPNPKDYSDNQCFCGGIKRMWKKNHGEYNGDEKFLLISIQKRVKDNHCKTITNSVKKHLVILESRS